MKVLLSLNVLCITLALCQAACFFVGPKAELTNGGVVEPRTSCIDHYDGNRHPDGSEWNTDHCMRCTCNAGTMRCCERAARVAIHLGCKAVVNPKTCHLEYYRIDNPLEPCS